MRAVRYRPLPFRRRDCHPKARLRLTSLDHYPSGSQVGWSTTVPARRHIGSRSPVLARSGHYGLVSDERNWFQVVAEQKCEECGLTASAVPQGELAPAISEEARLWVALLSEGHEPDMLRHRPEPGVWSPLEYAAHVRDVLGLFQERAALDIVHPEPEFGWWDHEAAAIDDSYNEQDPWVVAARWRLMLRDCA